MGLGFGGKGGAGGLAGEVMVTAASNISTLGDNSMGILAQSIGGGGGNGGIAIGVASNEAERRGIDEWKRSRLIQAGAHLIVPDFREADVLVRFLWNEV